MRKRAAPNKCRAFVRNEIRDFVDIAARMREQAKIAVGASAAGYIFNVLMVARAPLLLFQGIATSLLPHLTRLRSRGGKTGE